MALLLVGAAAGCAPANYLYGFDLTDPGARNFADFRRPDALEDPDVIVELRLDPTEFKAVALDITNKTDAPLAIAWDQISIIGPDRSQVILRPTAPQPAIEPGARVSTQLLPFELPAQGPAAKAYDGTTFELVIPLVARGVARENRYHLRARLQKI